MPERCAIVLDERFDGDQPPWAPGLDGGMRVSARQDDAVTSTTPSDDRAPAAGVRAVLARHRALVGGVAAVVCAALAVVWTVVVPEQAEQASAVRSAVIRLGHPVCWALLALAAVLYAARAPRRWVEAAAYAGLAAYAAFVLALLL